MARASGDSRRSNGLEKGAVMNQRIEVASRLLSAMVSTGKVIIADEATSTALRLADKLIEAEKVSRKGVLQWLK